jgi:hypothetical protein
MALLDWTLVVFGTAVALTGSWIQLNPHRLFPFEDGHWNVAPAAIAQVRRLGASFVFMGTFFALQMTIILSRQPWWTGTLSGLFAASAAVALLRSRARRKQGVWRSIARRAMEQKALEAK